MRHLTQEAGEPLCMIYSLAMVLDAEVSDIIKEVGKTGARMTKHGCREGIHPVEMYDCIIKRGYFPSFINIPELICHNEKLTTVEWDIDKFIKGNRLLVFTESHCMAVNEEGVVFDPNLITKSNLDLTKIRAVLVIKSIK